MADNVCARACAAAAGFGVPIEPEELAAVAERGGFGKGELEAVAAVFGHLEQRREEHVAETLLRLSRLPRTAPKTFEGFGFSRIQGRDAAALRGLPGLANLHSRKNTAFIGPGGIGRTRLAQAYGRGCCLRGYKTHCVKATEPRDKLGKAAGSGDPSRTASAPVRPSRPIVDEVGRRTFDRECTDPFFDAADRRYEREGPNTLVLTSDAQANNWGELFAGDGTLPCALDRIFDRASVFVMRGPSFRGAGPETSSVESRPAAVRDKRQRAEQGQSKEPTPCRRTDTPRPDGVGHFGWPLSGQARWTLEWRLSVDFNKEALLYARAFSPSSASAGSSRLLMACATLRASGQCDTAKGLGLSVYLLEQWYALGARTRPTTSTS